MQASRIQTVMFVRHGVAQHNLLNERTGQAPDLTDPQLTDPPLIHHGKRQALEAGEQAKRWWTLQDKHVQLVVTSPLTRCLQTAALMFLPGDEYTSNRPEPTIVCVDHVREAFGQHYPDRRRNRSELMVRYFVEVAACACMVPPDPLLPLQLC